MAQLTTFRECDVPVAIARTGFRLYRDGSPRAAQPALPNREKIALTVLSDTVRELV
jgi:hypothetical protein